MATPAREPSWVDRTRQGTLQAFVEQLARLGGREALLRCLVAVAQGLARALPVVDRHEAQYVVLTLRAVEAYITNPTQKRRKAVLKARRECVPPLDSPEPGRGHVGRLERVMFRTVEALLAGSEVDQVTHGKEGLGTVLALEARSVVPVGFVMAALAAEVAPWALGLADPLPARRDALI